MRRMQTRAAIGLSAVAAVVLLSATGEDDWMKEAEDAVLKSNSACMVCHIDFEEEELTVQHQNAGVMCAACHGLSVSHMNDEMAATGPDQLFGRAEVAEMCGQCHEEHENPKAVEAFLKEWNGRRRPNGQLIVKDSICTDCHGRHVRLQAPMPQAKPRGPEWQSLFNGKDLTGWKPAGNAAWAVENGVLSGRQDKGEAGDLYTEGSYDDFELVVTFKVQWPANSGIWFRVPEDGLGYQMDILDLQEYGCTTGSIWSGDFLSKLTDESIANRDGWNTADILAVGDRITVTLNGKVVADLKDSRRARGRIGFQVHAGERYASMAILVRDARIRPLGLP
jgi:hypothetical protein